MHVDNDVTRFFVKCAKCSPKFTSGNWNSFANSFLQLKKRFIHYLIILFIYSGFLLQKKKKGSKGAFTAS